MNDIEEEVKKVVAERLRVVPFSLACSTRACTRYLEISCRNLFIGLFISVVFNPDQVWQLIQKTPYPSSTMSPRPRSSFPRPSDCDFFGSPIGFKSCHYEKQVQVFDNTGRLIVDGYAVDWRERVVRGQAYG